ncbi:MAG TPA: hypothetical protein VLN09_11625 [Psychrobacter sp.]|uniref:hypothetical protein n=1 Tax=Psychrobacter sp. TaxID=56811 RepID=UPI002C6483CD|nr:hypothetical protein [Psychrobacter sp.]HSP86364.1 hypothetical protein [Psychrobacter sp.]
MHSHSKQIGDERKTNTAFYHCTTVLDPHGSMVSLAWAGGTFATAVLALLGIGVALTYNNIGRGRHYPRYW